MSVRPLVRRVALLLGLLAAAATFDAAAIDESLLQGGDTTKPATPAPAPAPVAPPNVTDMVGTWQLAPAQPDLSLTLHIDQRAHNGPVECDLSIKTPDGNTDETCTISRSGNRVRIAGRVASSSAAAHGGDVLIGTVDPRGTLDGKLESRRGMDVHLVLRNSPAFTDARKQEQQKADRENQAKQAAIYAKWLADATPEMVQVPAGSFTMGSPWNEFGRSTSEGPQHKVQVAAFEIGRYPVTFEQWDACVADGGCSNEPSDMGWGRGRQPVINVSWLDVQGYLKWLSAKTGKTFRLPSEAEWEYAARGGTTTSRWWGDAIGDGNANCDGCGGKQNVRHSSEVGAFKANPFGLYDVLGNVWQLTEDCWREKYAETPADGSAWEGPADCPEHAVRGGAWNRSAGFSRSASRLRVSASESVYTVGFRVARSLP